MVIAHILENRQSLSTQNKSQKIYANVYHRQLQQNNMVYQVEICTFDSLGYIWNFANAMERIIVCCHMRFVYINGILAATFARSHPYMHRFTLICNALTYAWINGICMSGPV